MVRRKKKKNNRTAVRVFEKSLHPIRRLSPLKGDNRGRAPVYFFKGTLEEIKSIPDEPIIKLFARKGILFSDVESGQMFTEFLRERVFRLAKELSKSNDRGMFRVETPEGILLVEVVKINNKYYVHQHPLRHGIKSSATNSTFENLRSILREGFTGVIAPNVNFVSERRTVSSYADPNRTGNRSENQHLIGGDKYTIELMGLTHGNSGFVGSAHPNKILAVTIKLHGEEKKLIEWKKRFYKEHITKEFGIPITFK